jgi:hypothetical protein
VLRKLLPFLDLLLILALAAYVLLGTPLAPFHADEATQIAMSRDYFIQFVEGDIARLRYDPAQPLTAEMQLRMINGTIPKTLMGAAWALAGGTADTLSGDWDWGADWDYNVSTGRYPSPDLLLATRLPSALLMAAAIPIMFALGWALGGRPVAWGAALLFALHPVLLLNSRRAMMEGALIFFSLLTVYASLRFVRTPSLWAAVLLGVASGLTIASKHTGAAIVAAVFAAVGLWMAIRWIGSLNRKAPRERRGMEAGKAIADGAGADEARADEACLVPTDTLGNVGTRHASSALPNFIMLLLTAALVVVVFFALNPAWWGGDSVGIARTILEWRRELIAGQSADHQGYRDAATQLLGFAQLSFGAQPQYFEVTGWSEIAQIREQIAAYEASPWLGWSLGTTQVGSFVFLILSIVGLFALLRDPQLAHGERLVLLLWTLACIGISYISPLAWQRYYLVVYPPLLLLAVYAPFGIRRVLKMWEQARG